MAIPLPGFSMTTSKSTSVSSLASTITAAVQNVIGEGQAAPVTSGQASSAPSLTDSTTPYTPPSYMPSGGVNNTPAAYSPQAGEPTPSGGLFDDPLLVGLLAAGGLAAAYFLT